MRKLLLSLLILAAVTPATAGEFTGKSGAALKRAIGATCRPTRPVDAASVGTTVMEIDHSLDRYSTDPATTVDRVVPLSWWGKPDQLSDTLTLDLYNIVPANADVARVKSHYAPGRVENVTFTNGVWSAGTATVSGTVINVYEPADQYKGDFARIYLYMATLYPAEFWDGYALPVYSDGDFPTLSANGVALLRAWHEADPVSDLERRRNDAIEAIQGNRNPFVDHPELVDHLWSSLADRPYEPEGERIPLRSRYSRSTTAAIDLYSPFVPDDATWSIDGVQATSTTIPLQGLADGIHLLEFKSPGANGQLKIEITQ